MAACSSYRTSHGPRGNLVTVLPTGREPELDDDGDVRVGHNAAFVLTRNCCFRPRSVQHQLWPVAEA